MILFQDNYKFSAISYSDTGNLEMTDSGSNIKINWNNYGDAIIFMIHFYNMRNQNNMIKIETINDSNKEEHILMDFINQHNIQ